MANKTVDGSELPKQLSIDYSEGNMHLCYEWRNRGSIVAVIFTAFWVIVVGSIFFEDFEKFTSNLQLLPFVLIFGGLTAFLVYYVVAHWLNKTDIIVKNGQLEVIIGPIPWPGRSKTLTNDITQFYNKKRVKGSKEKRRVSYEVHYILVDKTEKSYSPA
jgi:hypothetical protein